MEYINYNWYWINWEDRTFWTGRRNLISSIKILKLGTDAHPYSASKIGKRALGVDSSESEKAATEEEKDSPDEPIAEVSFLTITDQTAHELDQLRISPIDRQPTPTNPYMSTIETHGAQIATALTTNIPVFGQVGLTRYPTADTGAGAAQTSRRSQTAGGTDAPTSSVQGTGSQEITGTRGQTSQVGSQPAGTNPPMVPPSGNQPTGGGPPQGPPGGGGSSGGGGSGGGQGLGANPAAANLPLAQQTGVLSGANGVMKGHAPEIFDGQRKNAAKFMRKFGLWKICNIRNEAMINPFQRIALALSYMKGPKVDDWVLQQGDRLTIRVQGNTLVNPMIPPTHHDDDETLWREFVVDFTRAFTDTALSEQAYAALTDLQMKGEDIDDYIATFESLIVKAGWERAAQGSLEMFKQGLTPGIHYRILNRNPVPRTIDDWYAAAREEMTRQQMICTSLGPRKKEYMNKRPHREPSGKFGFKKKDPNAMEIDAAVIGKGSDSPNWRERCGSLTEQEKKKCQIEGCCFLCGRQGHMRRNCQRRNDGKGKETKARKANTKETREQEC